MDKTIKLTLNKDVLLKYYKHYFNEHKKAKKIPIEKPYHPSINTWFILPRLQMNDLKQKWKDFIIWWINDLGYNNMNIDSFDLYYKVFFDTKRRHDCDNQIPKFILDGFTESGLIIDDDEKHLHNLIISTGYDKENPRTEIILEREKILNI